MFSNLKNQIHLLKKTHYNLDVKEKQISNFNNNNNQLPEIHKNVNHFYEQIQRVEDVSIEKSTNVIFLCVFGLNYLDLLLLFLDSFYLFSDLSSNTDILIYTSSELANCIKQTPYYTKRVHFEINDKYTTILEYCSSRLDYFTFSCSNDYQKVLYLDIDILICYPIRDIFECVEDDILYVVEEGTLLSDTDFWGKSLFNIKDTTITGFSSGVMLFPTSKRIESLFEITKEKIKSSSLKFLTQEQPFIIHTFVMQNCYDNQILKKFVYINNNVTINNFKYTKSLKQPIIHFCGIPGKTSHKLENMKTFLNSYKEYICGSMSIDKDVWTISTHFRYDIIHFFANKSKYSIAEIGSYKGYTTSFLSKLFKFVIAVDNNPEFHFMNMKLNSDRQNIHYALFDLYQTNWSDVFIDNVDIQVAFIDAGHSYEQCKSDIDNCLSNFKNIKYIIFDDYGVWSGVKKAVDEYIHYGKLQFETFIGMYDYVPGPNNTFVNNVNEGIIVSTNNLKEKYIDVPTKDNTIVFTLSINYADYLEISLKHNHTLFNKIYVITDPNDKDTQKCCEKYTNIEVLLYDDAFKNGAEFDKTTLLRRAQLYLNELYPKNWMLYIDGDTIVPSNLFEILSSETNISESTIFLSQRKIYQTEEDFLSKTNAHLDESTKYHKGAGFFNLYFSKKILYPYKYQTIKGKRSAEGCDIVFQSKFYDRRFIESIICSHIGNTCVNWEGRLKH